MATEAHYVTIDCPACQHRATIALELVAIGPQGLDLHIEGGHYMLWTCPCCATRSTKGITGATGRLLIDNGADTDVPEVRAVLVSHDGWITFDAVGHNTRIERRRICQHFGPDSVAARHLFADDREADRWLARALHPAGGES